MIHLIGLKEDNVGRKKSHPKQSIRRRETEEISSMDSLEKIQKAWGKRRQKVLGNSMNQAVWMKQCEWSSVNEAVWMK